MGRTFAALPADAVKLNSPGAPQSSLIMLSGKYVDSDGIIYFPDGAVDEAGTAAWAREVAAGRVMAPYFDWQDEASGQRAESVQENASADQLRTWLDAMESNIATTAAEIPGRVVAVASTVGSTAFSVGKWIVAGLVAYAVIETLQAAKRDGVPLKGLKSARHYRRRAARAIYQRIAGSK